VNKLAEAEEPKPVKTAKTAGRVGTTS